MFEIIIGIINGALAIAVYKLYSERDKEDRDGFFKTTKLKDRVEKLEIETRYRADQPQTYYSVGSAFFDAERYEEELHKNDVPITDVVKAIVNHLGMEVLKSPERTTKTPMEVKVVEKPVTGTVITGVDGNVGATWVSPCEPQKTKRKYAKRKTGANK